MLYFTKQERQVFLFVIAAIFTGLVLDLSLKGRWERISSFYVLDDPSFYPKVNINKAALDELLAVPSLGPAMSKLIIDRRPFLNLEALRTLPGVGEGKLEKMRRYLKVK